MKLINTKTLEYPVSEEEFRSRFPNTSFSAMLDKQTLADYGYAVVFPSPSKEAERLPVLTSKGHWEEVWI